jgi:predicted DsbA family dithiol-disulfide isomerase
MFMNDTDETSSICGVEGCGPAIQNAPGIAVVNSQLIIVSDVICPWCFIAKRNLRMALERAGHQLQLKITWRPFELNPTMPAEGMDRRTYRSTKFGSWEYSQSLDMQVAAAGMRAGIEFRHDLMVRTPNTLNAHRLIWLAEQEGMQDAVVEALFQAYFTEGSDVGDPRTLIEIGVGGGMDEQTVAGMLAGTRGVDEVRLQEQAALAGGISGVPTFMIGDRILFSGALKPETMVARLVLGAAADAG